MTVDTPPSKDESSNVYILITQCLQNSFFLSNENNLVLPEETVKQMLVGTGESASGTLTKDDERRRRHIDDEQLRAGPLYQFLKSVIQSTQRNDQLHVINIKDWHPPSDNYDRERRRYGTHCSAKSWGAQILEGFEELLEPWNRPTKDGKSLTPDGHDALSADGYTVNINGDSAEITYYEVRSDTLFDFQPVQTQTFTDKNMATYSIEKSHLSAILDKLIGDVHEWHHKRVYCAVIGVYSDIKINTLLTGLRSRYLIQNLIVSDVLTGAPSLERHLAGLDFADKVLQVEIIHSLNELASVLHGGDFNGEIDSEIIRHNIDFNNYRSYFLDKQNVLSYQDAKIAEYLNLTTERANAIYNFTFTANKWAVRIGYGFILLALILLGLSIDDPERLPAWIALATGGVGLLPLLTNFVFNPLDNLQKNMGNLVRMRNYLESYSTVNALMRHHLTIPELLSQSTMQDERDGQKIALDRLERQLALIRQSTQIMTETFGTTTQRMNPEEDTSPVTPADAGPTPAAPPPTDFSNG